MMNSPHRRSLKESVALEKKWLLDKSDAVDLTMSETIEIVNYGKMQSHSHHERLSAHFARKLDCNALHLH
jgi:hypothetical protein